VSWIRKIDLKKKNWGKDCGEKKKLNLEIFKLEGLEQRNINFEREKIFTLKTNFSAILLLSLTNFSTTQTLGGK